MTPLRLALFLTLVLAPLVACDDTGETGDDCGQYGLHDCSGACRDLNGDGLNCGQCGVVCPAGLVCSFGVCAAACDPPLSQCGSSCADLTVNFYHCGACDRACTADTTCVQGICNGVGPGDPVGTGGDTGLGGAPGLGGTSNLGGAPTAPQGTWLAPVSAEALSRIQGEYAAWKDRFFTDCGNGTGCIEDLRTSICVSEGVGYGMLIAAGMGDQALLDSLWGYYLAHRNGNGFMHWETNACGSVTSSNGASDADLDAAMALLQAEAKWGGYANSASTLVSAIRAYETETCSNRIILRPGDAWGGCSNGNTVNPSYFSPGYYRVFAGNYTSQSSHWMQMISDTYTLYGQYQNSLNGLICGWADLNSGCTSDYDYDAVRAPWRVATDYAWTGDAAPGQVLQRISDYVDRNGGIAGVPFDPNSAFRGSLALSGMVRGQAVFDQYVSDWLASATSDSQYYQGTLRVLFLMFAAGQFPSTY